MHIYGSHRTLARYEMTTGERVVCVFAGAIGSLWEWPLDCDKWGLDLINPRRKLLQHYQIIVWL